jgi:hypothetical protein
LVVIHGRKAVVLRKCAPLRINVWSWWSWSSRSSRSWSQAPPPCD